MEVQEIKTRSSTRAASILNHSTISPDPNAQSFKNIFDLWLTEFIDAETMDIEDQLYLPFKVVKI